MIANLPNNLPDNLFHHCHRDKDDNRFKQLEVLCILHLTEILLADWNLLCAVAFTLKSFKP